MTPPQTPKLARWGRAAVVAAVGLAAAGAFALIAPSHELDSEAFLKLVFAQQAEVRSVHITHMGAATMSNGDVNHTYGEGALVYGGDSQGYFEYEGCPIPIGSLSNGVRLCKTEWVELGGIRYERRTTSEGPGEWEIMDSAQAQSNDVEVQSDRAEVPDYWSRSYGLVELGSETVDGVEYRRFRTSHHPIRRMLERAKAREWKPPADVPITREEFIESLQEQSEAETGAIELWARVDNGTIWKIITERDNLNVNASEPRGFPVATRTYDVIEYSRYNEPVVIKPPI